MLLGKKLVKHFVDQTSKPKMWGRKVFRMFLLTVVVYITFGFLIPTEIWVRVYREYYHFASQYSISLSLCFVVVSYVHSIFWLNKSDKISPANLATLLPVAKRRYNSKPSSATSNSATSPWNGPCAKPVKKRFETDPFLMDQGEGLCWYPLQIDVLYKYLATLEYSVV